MPKEMMVLMGMPLVPPKVVMVRVMEALLPRERETGGTQHASQGSRVRQAKNEPAQPSGLDRNVVGENPPQTWVTDVNVGKNEIPKNVGQHGDEKHVVHGQGVEGSMPRGFENQVNPFWSPECKRDAHLEKLMGLAMMLGFKSLSALVL